MITSQVTSNISINSIKSSNLADTKLQQAARDLEATFLAEMLKSAGFGESRESFGGGIGEEQFASFLRNSHAKTMVEAGGIGLSEHLFHALKSRGQA